MPITSPRLGRRERRYAQARGCAGHDRKDQFAQTCPGALRSSDARRLEVRMIDDCADCAGPKASPVRPDMFSLHDVMEPAKTRQRAGYSRNLFWTTSESLGNQPSGGARRDRTDDLMLAKHALSQLSYGPEDGISRASQKAGGPGRT